MVKKRIVPIEQMPPIPISKPIIEMEDREEMMPMTKPQTTKISPEVKMVGIAD